MNVRPLDVVLDELPFILILFFLSISPFYILVRMALTLLYL